MACTSWPEAPSPFLAHEDDGSPITDLQPALRSSSAASAWMPIKFRQTELLVKCCGSVLLLRTDLAFQVAKLALQLHLDLPLSLSRFCLRSTISWKAFRNLVERELFDEALRDLLNSYVPFQQRKSSAALPTCRAAGRVSLEHDCLKLADASISFIVHRGRIFLDLLSSFTILGQLRLAFMNDWTQVDLILEQQGLSQKEAFRRNHKSRSKERKWSSQRSHITLKAIQVLAQHGLVQDPGLKKTVVQVLSHLQSEIDALTQLKATFVQQLETQIQQVSQGGQEGCAQAVTSRKESDSECSSSVDSHRKSRFPARCCPARHVLSLAGKEVSYVVKNGLLFLEKCGAFESLGRMYVIRCSDYRRSDKKLEQMGLKPQLNYLYVNSASPSEGKESRIARRNKRTHISFAALVCLIKSDFADGGRKKELLESIGHIEQHYQDLMAQCSRHQPDQSPAHLVSVKQEPSEPVCQPEKPLEASDVQLIKVNILKQPVTAFHEYGQLYLILTDMTFFLREQDQMLPRLKRKARALDVILPIFPPFFLKKNGDHFISLECFRSLTENQLVGLSQNTDKVAIHEALVALEKEHQLTTSQSVVTSDLAAEEAALEDVADEEADDMKLAECCIPRVQIRGAWVAVQVVNNRVFLEKKTMLRSLNLDLAYKMMDKILEANSVCLDDSFLYEGRRRSFISSTAIKALVRHTFESDPDKRDALLSSLDVIDQAKDSYRVDRLLRLKSFNDIGLKMCKGTVFLRTDHFMRAAGMSKSYLHPHPSKAYFFLVRHLKRRGLDVSACFLKLGKSKYSHLSIYAATTLCKTQFGPFKDKKKVKALHKEILLALRAMGIGQVNASTRASPVLVSAKDSSACNVICLGTEFPPLRYQVRHHEVFVHRKSCFQMIGMEKAVLAHQRGYAIINSILTQSGLDPEYCYLKGHQQQYAFISLRALLVLLESDSALLSCLERRPRFFHCLLNAIQATASDVLQGHLLPLPSLGVQLPFRRGANDDGHLMLDKKVAFRESGLDEKLADWQGEDTVSVASLLDLTRCDSEMLSRASDYHKLLWKNMIDAVMQEVPKLKIRVKVMEFRQALLGTLVDKFTQALESQVTCKEEALSPLPIVQVEKLSSEETHFIRSLDLKAPGLVTSANDAASLLLHTWQPLQEASDTEIEVEEEEEEEEAKHESVFCLNRQDFLIIHSAVSGNQDQGIGDWQIDKCDPEEIRLIVSPGSNASRKMSFIQPDVWAILKYELILKPDWCAELLINDRIVPLAGLHTILSKAIRKGVFNLLYTVLTLRPCFGCFNPELVETFQNNGHYFRSETLLDTKFIGSSQSGRTYAGCVRSRRCVILAESKVSDTCAACASLTKIAINRSVLSTNAVEEEDLVGQTSVWKLSDTDSSGCTFVCPQLQSFNTSLPHHFISSQQATSVVTHQVFIAHDLTTTVSLNGHLITSKTFPHFTENNQLGPLLEWVASLRFCIGYPDIELVDKARYLTHKKSCLPPETSKFFDYIVVDETFSWRLQDCGKSGHGGTFRGSLRTPSCRFVAEDFADICGQCRLLQEPLEFLSLKKP